MDDPLGSPTLVNNSYVISAFLSALGIVYAGLRFVSSSTESVRKDVLSSTEAVRKELNVRVDGVDQRITELGTTTDSRIITQTASLRSEMEKGDDKVSTAASKAYHGLANSMQTQFVDLKAELKSMRQESYRASDGKRLEDKLDEIAKDLKRQPVLEEGFRALKESVDKLAARPVRANAAD